MLEADYRKLFEGLVAQVDWRIELPPEMSDFFKERGYTSPNAFDERRCPRAHTRHRAVMYLTRPLPAFPRAEGPLGIYTANLSRIGIGFLFHQQLYPGEEARILLPAGWFETVVTRGRRLGPACYEAGASIARVHTPEPDPGEERVPLGASA